MSTKLPVYEYQQEPIFDVRTWIANAAYYVGEPELSDHNQAVAYWPYCEKVTYSHKYAQTGNVANRQPRLNIQVVFTLLADGSHGLLLYTEWGRKHQGLFVIDSIRARVNPEDGKTYIIYELIRPLRPDEVELYRPANVRP